MIEEQFKKLWQDSTKEAILHQYYYDYLDSEDNRIRINKAITYIEKFVPIDTDTFLMKERQRNYLLSILHGDDKE